MKNSKIKRALRKLKFEIYSGINGKISNKHRKDFLYLPEKFNFNGQDLAFANRLIELKPAVEGEQWINWLVPSFTHPYGGVFTIFRIADALEKKGFKNRIIVYDNPEFELGSREQTIHRYFPNMDVSQVIALKAGEDSFPASDFCVATFWTSCYLLMKIRNTKRKLYLIQDFEPGFYGVDTNYAVVENTYRMPFHRVFNTKGLMDFVNTNYPINNVKSMFFTPGVDENYRLKVKELKKPIRILFYGRPSTPRNAFELTLSFIKRIKDKYGDEIEIVSAGENYDLIKLGLRQYKTYFKNYGVIPYEKLSEFYSGFHFTIAFMLTKHPSYLPFEAMANGSVVIANYNEANTWLLKHNENSIFVPPSIDMLVEAFDEVMSSEELYNKLLLEAHRTVKAVNWKNEINKVCDFFEDLI